MQQNIQSKTTETMSRSFDTSSQYGWNTTSLEYAEHVARMERMPSVVTDAPLFPSVRSAMKDKVTYEEEREEKYQQVNHSHKHHNQEAQKKVHLTEHEKFAEVVKDGRDEGFAEKDVDLEADGFIKQNHKIFEMHKWPTFKVC